MLFIFLHPSREVKSVTLSLPFRSSLPLSFSFFLSVFSLSVSVSVSLYIFTRPLKTYQLHPAPASRFPLPLPLPAPAPSFKSATTSLHPAPALYPSFANPHNSPDIQSFHRTRNDIPLHSKTIIIIFTEDLPLLTTHGRRSADPDNNDGRSILIVDTFLKEVCVCRLAIGVVLWLYDLTVGEFAAVGNVFVRYVGVIKSVLLFLFFLSIFSALFVCAYHCYYAIIFYLIMTIIFFYYYYRYYYNNNYYYC